MESSPPRVNTQLSSVVGVKRSASLLPPFDPSSSPPLPRPMKRLAREDDNGISTYPTPMPTSSTAILTSSPPRARRGLKRTHSMASERAPLSAVPCIMLSESGDPTTMGRSSVSCNYQLSANRLVSRVHVKATYRAAANPFERDRIEILCTGWNGIKLHCQGKTYELTKGKTFTSDIRDADVMIDVQDSRVLLQWPRQQRKNSTSLHSDQTWEDSSPTKDLDIGPRRSTPASPLQRKQRLASPISPSPAVQALGASIAPLTPSQPSSNKVIVYEDEPSPIGRRNSTANSMSQRTQLASQPLSHSQQNSLSSSLSKSEELSEHDEENDPIILSFGPFGANLLPRMASFHASESPIRPSPEKPKSPGHIQPPPSPKKNSESESITEAIQNHIVNQLAFSRLASTPLSTIIKNLPTELIGKLSSERCRMPTGEVMSIIEDTQCIGKVSREGKDAAGKPLESEYYYVPDMDQDEKRREAVVNDLRKPGLRNCRKQHKVG
ncbi:target of SBF [Emydomyces testavorans]|uniref:Target of SBF n=1 Tax=Emydomyces testavorans TaxID=2070801 RepID=A0AAF0DG29_9EURO|nr:target of SBF [Emydomyces testavorans]